MRKKPLFSKMSNVEPMFQVEINNHTMVTDAKKELRQGGF
jgi:hypothetical protein